MICALENKNIVAADIVELCPEFDNGSTGAIAARLMSTIIAMNLKG
jgi:agmatinase